MSFWICYYHMRLLSHVYTHSWSMWGYVSCVETWNHPESHHNRKADASRVIDKFTDEITCQLAFRNLSITYFVASLKAHNEENASDCWKKRPSCICETKDAKSSNPGHAKWLQKSTQLPPCKRQHCKFDMNENEMPTIFSSWILEHCLAKTPTEKPIIQTESACHHHHSIILWAWAKCTKQIWYYPTFICLYPVIQVENSCCPEQCFQRQPFGAVHCVTTQTPHVGNAITPEDRWKWFR